MKETENTDEPLFMAIDTESEDYKKTIIKAQETLPYFESKLSNIKDEDIERIVSYLSNQAGKRAGGKTAIIARTDLDYEITKKYELFTQLKGLSVTIEVFRSLGEAMIWLDRHSL